MQAEVIVNPNSTNSGKVISFLQANNLSYQICRDVSETPNILKAAMCNSGLLIIAGGDGTINNFVNCYMKIRQKEKKFISFGFLPGGRTNDFVRSLGLPIDIRKSYSRIIKNNVAEKDIISVNGIYFLTGGGFGLPAETVINANSLSLTSLGRVVSNFLGNFVYLIEGIKLVIMGYKGVEAVSVGNQRHENLMALCVGNGVFIGKRFYTTPVAKDTDGLMDICLIKKPDGILRNLLLLRKIMGGHHINESDTVYIKIAGEKLRFEKAMSFMADGEILATGHDFAFKVVPKQLKVLI